MMFSKLMMCVIAVSMMMVSLPMQASAAPAKKPLGLVDVTEPKNLPAEWRARYPRLKVLRASLLDLEKKEKEALKKSNSAMKKMKEASSTVRYAESQLYRVTARMKCLLVQPALRKWHPFLRCSKAKLNKGKIRISYLKAQEYYAGVSLRHSIFVQESAECGIEWRNTMIVSLRKQTEYWQEFIRAVQQEMKYAQGKTYALSELKELLKYAKDTLKAPKKMVALVRKSLPTFNRIKRGARKDFRKDLKRLQLAKKIRKLLTPLVNLEGAKLRKAYKKRLRKLPRKWRKRVRKKLHSPFL